MGRVYYKKLPLFHLYDSDLTGTLKLLMTLLLVARYDIETVLLGIEYRLHGCAWVCMVSCEVTRFRKVDTPRLRRGHRPPLFQRISGK